MIFSLVPGRDILSFCEMSENERSCGARRAVPCRAVLWKPLAMDQKSKQKEPLREWVKLWGHARTFVNDLQHVPIVERKAVVKSVKATPKTYFKWGPKKVTKVVENPMRGIRGKQPTLIAKPRVEKRWVEKPMKETRTKSTIKSVWKKVSATRTKEHMEFYMQVEMQMEIERKTRLESEILKNEISIATTKKYIEYIEWLENKYNIGKLRKEQTKNYDLYFVGSSKSHWSVPTSFTDSKGRSIYIHFTLYEGSEVKRFGGKALIACKQYV